ncbi:Aminopeptidase N, related [Neospora caninum Liverpool]|uniref:Aminopeptidase N, related n=1 Tax=Neospora caninum (strain Liverpool) TaxID=572307 RepID=F0VMB5_NEOCL|nr:Aminopeptidase N, related [Neospora caninum Liverpool]CBZ54393.1 Aminopeptidase N, related [Neospora caninum Liverpool]|eukprot:XP_003884423.1 Aminopeptidase N, related [Neospora caninum Liverpool]
MPFATSPVLSKVFPVVVECPNRNSLEDGRTNPASSKILQGSWPASQEQNSPCVLLACFIKAEVAGAREADGECKAVERLAYAPPNLYLEDIVMNFELDDEDTTHLLPSRAEDGFYIRTVVSINPKANLALFGLYKAGDIFVTLNEPSGFRRITYSIDRPDVLATYKVRVSAPTDLPVLLSNGDKVLSGPAPGNRHFAEFVYPYPKPSYIFALVAGNFASVSDDFITMSGRRVKVSIYAQLHQQHQLQWALRTLLKAMRWDERTYGREYQYTEFRVLCVEVFNPGAMENTSLNIFSAASCLPIPSSRLIVAQSVKGSEKCRTYLVDAFPVYPNADYRLVVDVVAHEYFHNWTGNRVTCRDWFQLTLKEGLTMFRNNSFTEETTSRAMKRIDDVSHILSIQFREDSGPFAHPIRPERYKSIENLYRTLLGPEGFRKGMDLYFSRHDGQAVTCDDLRAAMADANNKDLTQFERWYTQAGTPQVTLVHSSYNAAQEKMHVTLSQYTPPTPGQEEKLPLHIPVAVGCIGKDSKRDVLTPATQIRELTEEEQSFVLDSVTEDCVLSVLRDFSAPVKLLYPAQTVEQLAFLVAHDSDKVNRWQASQTLSRGVLLTRISEYHARAEEIENGDVAEHDVFSPLPDDYVETMRTIVTAPESCMKKDIKAVLLTLPSKAQLELAVDSIDPDTIHAAVTSVRRDVAEQLGEEMLRLYRELTLPEGTEESGADIPHWGRRALRNELLRFLTATLDEKSALLASRHYHRAMVMSDKVAALTVLTEIPGRERDEAFEHFYQEVAGATLERVAALSRHEAFQPFVPGPAYSLFRAFSSTSPQFHSKTGTGYAMVTDFLLMIDEHNSLVSARIAGPAFSNWKRFTPPRREMLKGVLQKLREKPGLSLGLKEVVDKALAGEDDA